MCGAEGGSGNWPCSRGDTRRPRGLLGLLTFEHGIERCVRYFRWKIKEGVAD